MLKYVILLLLIFSFNTTANNLEKFSQDTQWIRSLHYKESFGVLKKGTKTDGFYFSSDADPLKELIANIEQAQKNTLYQCIFPFRAKMLERAGLWKPRAISCPSLLNWKGVFDKNHLSLAFASQYMSNPASVFGHTFLVFSPTQENRKIHPAYLDITVGYAAEMPTDVGVVKYIVYGLGGGFKGKFFDEPLYHRIHEYSNMELRDLWIYPLKARPEQIDDLLDHIFEISEKNYFDYFFLDENCSYMLLKILEVIFPEEDLSKKFHSYVVPIETIKVLEEKNLLDKGFLIPSMRSKFLFEYNQLKTEEKNHLKDAIKGNSETLKSKESVDVMITYLDKKKIENKEGVSHNEQELYKKLLIKRSKLGPKDDFSFDTKTSLDPIQSHFPFSLYLKSGAQTGRQFQELEFRPAMHDLLDLGYGQIQHSQIRLLVPTLRLLDDNTLRLQKFQFANITNLVAYKAIDPIYSWNFILERDRLNDQFCIDCLATRIKVEAGYSFSLTNFLDFYFLAGLSSDYSSDLKKGFRLGPGIHSGAIFNFEEVFKLHHTISYYFVDNFLQLGDALLKFGLDLSYNISQQYALKAQFYEIHTLPSSKNTNEFSTSFVFYF